MLQGAMLEAKSTTEYINLPLQRLHFIGYSDSCDTTVSLVRNVLLVSIYTLYNVIFNICCTLYCTLMTTV